MPMTVVLVSLKNSYIWANKTYSLMKRSIYLFLTTVLLLTGTALLSQDRSALAADDQAKGSYYLSFAAEDDFEATVEQVKKSLKEAGFGIVSEIDMQAKLKKGTGKDIPKYLILGACHPPSAYEALQVEEHIGVMLPCNVIVRETKSGEVEVAAINPKVSMKSIGNPEMEYLADDITTRLQRALGDL
jgi:uncharacterized protein (DUF302 family)